MKLQHALLMEHAIQQVERVFAAQDGLVQLVIPVLLDTMDKNAKHVCFFYKKSINSNNFHRLQCWLYMSLAWVM